MSSVGLNDVLKDVADGLVAIDSSLAAFKTFQGGVGPYGEPQMVRGIAEHLRALDTYRGTVRTTSVDT